MPKKEPRIITHDKCPACGSTNRYCESLGKQEIGRGHMRREMSFHLQIVEGVCLDNAIVEKLPIGTGLPAYRIMTDLCSDCGTIYVVKIEESVAVKKPQIMLPGQKGFGPPNLTGMMNTGNN